MTTPPHRPEDTPAGAGSAWQPPPTGPAPASATIPAPPRQWGPQQPPPPGYPPHWHGAGTPPTWQQPLAPNGQPLASFLDRFLAYLIDVVIYTAVSLIWGIPYLIWWFNHMFTWMNEYSSRYDPSGPVPVEPPIGELMSTIYGPMFAYVGASLLLGFLFTYLYFCEFQLRRGGQTVGKRVMKIRVIPTAPDATLGRGHLAKRWGIQHVAASFVPMGGLINGLWQLWDKPLQQCLHDKVAATVVVKVG